MRAEILVAAERAEILVDVEDMYLYTYIYIYIYICTYYYRIYVSTHIYIYIYIYVHTIILANCAGRGARVLHFTQGRAVKDMRTGPDHPEGRNIPR